MNCKATLAGAALAAGASVVIAGASWSATITIPSHIDGCCESGIPIFVAEAGFDPLATSDHPEDGADLLAIGGSSGPDAVALGSGGETGNNGLDAPASMADPEPSALTRLLIAFSDLRERVFGGP
jgi:hypothetical protein